MEGFTNLKHPSPEKDASIILHFANMECIRVFNRRQVFGKRPQAWLISGGWDFQIQRIMRPLEIVLLPPFVEGRLQMSSISPLVLTDEFFSQSPVESFVFSQGLGMIRTTMNDPNIQANQPDTESCKGTPVLPRPKGCRCPSTWHSEDRRGGTSQ